MEEDFKVRNENNVQPENNVQQKDNIDVPDNIVNEINKRLDEVVKKDEENQGWNKTHKPKKSGSGKNIVIGILVFILIILVSVCFTQQYKIENLSSINETAKLQLAYNQGASDLSLKVLNQIVSGLNNDGYFEIDLPSDNNQTKLVKLGVIQ